MWLRLGVFFPKISLYAVVYSAVLLPELLIISFTNEQVDVFPFVPVIPITRIPDAGDRNTADAK